MESHGHSSTIKSLAKAASALKCFTPQALELGTCEVSRMTGLPTTTAYRLLITLVENGFLERNANNGKYKIGPTLYALGSLYLTSTDLVSAAHPVVKAISEMTGEVTNVGILFKGNNIIILREESALSLRWSLHVGSTQPAYTTAIGKALLSELPEEELDTLYPEETLKPLTSRTVRSKTALKLDLKQVRKTGISFSIQEAQEGIVGIASVIRDAGGKPAAAFAIGTLVYTLTAAKRERLVTLTKMSSNLISYRLGYLGTGNPVRDINEVRSWWESNKNG